MKRKQKKPRAQHVYALQTLAFFRQDIQYKKRRLAEIKADYHRTNAESLIAHYRKEVREGREGFRIWQTRARHIRESMSTDALRLSCDPLEAGTTLPLHFYPSVDADIRVYPNMIMFAETLASLGG